MRCGIALFFWCLCTVVCAQSSIDVVTLSGFYGSPADYEQPLNGKASEYGTLFNLKIPVVLNEKTIWYSDFTHTFYSIKHNLEQQPPDMLTSMRLHAFILQTGIARKLNNLNALQLLVVPRYTTDFKGADKKNWQWGTIALYEHRFSQPLLMRFGALFNKELFGPLVVPLIFADWKINERWNINGLFPIHLKVNYKLNQQLVTGFSHFGFITTYRINQESFKTDYVERNSIDEALFLRWKMAGNFYLETRVGYSLSRVYKQFDENDQMKLRISLIALGDNRDQKNITFASGPTLSARLVYNLSLESKN
jgi:hypothetical protein